MTNDTSLLLQSYQEAHVFYSTPPLSEQPVVIEKARKGCKQSREAIITSCLPYVLTVARTYHLAYDVEFDELVGYGNLVLVENLDIALQKNNACSYLKGSVKRQLYYFCLKHSKLLELKEYDQNVAEPAPEAKDYTFLYEAIGQLPEHLKDVVVIHYGLLDTPKESLYELSRKQSCNSKGTILYLRLRQATKNLRQILAS